MAERRWVGLVSAVLLVAGGVGYAVQDRERDERARAEPPQTTGTPGTNKAAAAVAERHRAVDALLRRRASAVLSKDLTQFLQDVDPALHAEQRILFANLVDLRFAHLAFRQDEERFDADVIRRHGPGVYLARVVMVYRIARVDYKAVKTELGYTFARQADRWTIVDDDDLDPTLAPGAHREPWDLGRFEVHRGSRVTVLVDPGSGARASRIIAESREALAAVAAYWPRQWRGSVLVIALDEQNVRDTRFDAEDAESAGSATSTFALLPGEETADGEVAGAYIVLNPKERDRVDEILLSHEFTHVATADLGGYEPLWLAEGAAEYVSWKGVEAISGPDELAEWERDVTEDALPKINALPSDSGFYDSPGDVYGVSWLAVRLLVKRLGIDRVETLYQSLARNGTTQTARDRIMLAHTQLTEASLFVALRSYQPGG